MKNDSKLHVKVDLNDSLMQVTEYIMQAKEDKNPFVHYNELRGWLMDTIKLAISILLVIAIPNIKFVLHEGYGRDRSHSPIGKAIKKWNY